MKDAFALSVFVLLFAWFVFYLPDYLGHADNYIEANPLSTPPHIVPEWYFLPYYAILRAIPDKLLGVIAMFSSILLLVFLPWLDTSRVRSAKYRPVYKWFFWLFIFTVVALGYLGSKPAEGAYVHWARVFTAYYFLHLLVVLPIVGVMETGQAAAALDHRVRAGQGRRPRPQAALAPGDAGDARGSARNLVAAAVLAAGARRWSAPRWAAGDEHVHIDAPEVELRRLPRQVRRGPAAARLQGLRRRPARAATASSASPSATWRSRAAPASRKAAIKSLAAKYQVDAVPNDQGKVVKRPAIARRLPSRRPSRTSRRPARTPERRAAARPVADRQARAASRANAPFYLVPGQHAARTSSPAIRRPAPTTSTPT